MFASFLFVLLGDERRQLSFSPLHARDVIKENVALTVDAVLWPTLLLPSASFVYQGDGYFSCRVGWVFFFFFRAPTCKVHRERERERKKEQSVRSENENMCWEVWRRSSLDRNFTRTNTRYLHWRSHHFTRYLASAFGTPVITRWFRCVAIRAFWDIVAIMWGTRVGLSSEISFYAVFLSQNYLGRRLVYLRTLSRVIITHLYRS